MKPLSETAAKKQVSQLQSAIIDGLEDVKAQNIQVFDTTELTPLFERVIIASGSSSRQTKALAASVRDKVREAGFNKPSIGGEDNGEWVTVDCGAVVAHIMQPAIRDYYRLEEIWGEKPVKLAAKKTSSKAVAKTPAKAAADNAQTADDGATPAPVKTSARKTTSRKAAASPDAATPVRKTATPKTPAKTATKATTKTAAKAPAKSAVNKAATKAATKSAAKTATAKAKPAA
ncbi:ribosome silencing factor [Allofranklinella schreckenbergeri]|uniref:Ribosomal silencing factor RsfS n=1 Tax=Allofranklinella schreckenbergeri TaxID=1076744 RepID=A0A3M6QSR7_9BURK|nr:ribosome silencing factor [Allofranklinella schreckenbergeri]RMX06070.1 ribosome silencing factor [Allofranklinella schreckenbergeri]